MMSEDRKDAPGLDELIKEWLESEDGQRFEKSWGAMANAYKQAMYKAIRDTYKRRWDESYRVLFRCADEPVTL